jgi:pyrimidine-nucleoside phosphorylase
MLSGRGLGHTGGTLDKLEAVPGYRIHLPNHQFLSVVAEVGCAIVGQSADIAPADGKIYALRDVTGTIDCVPLITASILSKKLAAGPASLVIDLKTGSGAFMADLNRARELARALVETAAHWQRPVGVIFSDMSQPLGRAVGHANEAIEAFAALRPQGRATSPPDLVELTTELVAEMVLLTGLNPDIAAARAQVRAVWDSGAAFDCLLKWVSAQGGQLDAGRDDFGLSVAPVAAEVTAERSGYIGEVHCREVGYSLADLGGARPRVEATIDLTAGIDFLVKVGDEVQRGQPLAKFHCQDPQKAKLAARRLSAAVKVSEEPTLPVPLILDRLLPS